MSKRLYALISTLVSCAFSAGAALVVYFQPPYFAAIASAFVIAETAINDILLLFVTDDVAAAKTRKK